ncbi:MAG: hypothetical protein U0W40_00265 [Acidimicrobiia bacterium]
MPAVPDASTESVLDRFLANHADAVDVMGGGPGGRHQRTPDVALCDSGGPVLYLNQALLLRPVLGLDDPVLDTVEEFFAGLGGRMGMLLSVWPLPDLSPRGWHLGGHPMFVVRAPGPVRHSPPADVEVRRVTALDDLRAVERVAIEGYPLDAARGLPPGAVFGDWFPGSSVGLHLGTLDGEPVAAGAVHVGHGVVNLCFAATMPAARRRGVWSAVMWDRVAVDPELPAVAFTSDDSRPGFVKHGFLPITRFTLFVRAGA